MPERERWRAVFDEPGHALAGEVVVDVMAGEGDYTMSWSAARIRMDRSGFAEVEQVRWESAAEWQPEGKWEIRRGRVTDAAAVRLCEFIEAALRARVDVEHIPPEFPRRSKVALTLRGTIVRISAHDEATGAVRAYMGSSAGARDAENAPLRAAIDRATALLDEIVEWTRVRPQSARECAFSEVIASAQSAITERGNSLLLEQLLLASPALGNDRMVDALRRIDDRLAARTNLDRSDAAVTHRCRQRIARLLADDAALLRGESAPMLSARSR